MERIKSVMQRLQDLYNSKHTKSGIDIDLMLDYTRVMYADLLGWRKSFKEEPVASQIVPPPTEVKEQPPVAPQEATTKQEPGAEQTLDEVIGQKGDEGKVEDKEAIDQDSVANDDAVPEADAPETESAGKADELPVAEQEPAEEATVEEEAKIFRPIERDEPGPQEPMVQEGPALIKEEPEVQDMAELEKTNTGISFEPPTLVKLKNEIREELLHEEPTSKPHTETIPVPLPVIEEPRMWEPEPQPLPNAARRDIRLSIGINDKYLFLNELFNNHKSNYEETLDKLNRMTTFEDAELWIKKDVAPVHKWEKGDATVDNFYALLGKHFSTR